LLELQGTAVLSVHPGLIGSDMGDAAGLSGITERPEVVAEGIMDALRAGDFHLFPDALARRVGEAYRSFSETVIEPGIPEYRPKQGATKA
jgi:hypothetical protein